MPAPNHLPGPNADIWDWQMHGLCRGVDSSMFFHPDGERGRARAQRETRAKEMCRRCPVLAQCRNHALSVSEPYGIWGGMSETEREMHGRHRRGRIAV
ncbi:MULTISPECIES: WhiB family transcriptional regulator [unclassified Rhodococcus (in: high G+C Gram-positive bacteria)]|jgi:WhiB family redox-sensing transcriptional regulator|uniref:WhiB family transcriptional regulator n=1 Tax=unclassified Rhodococcus (in: high G+C Gram-positive bacteria) TaxID=192944 RepID=UPI0016395E86|nr:MULTISPECIES: WhiB family transcriptional regulator [unclassified Rhodococcus (in: high G+C Gram-positive bacteria)]MBC2643414.1 WhiB family transcriptional regulator [Rhodococcus sp. 3A]MBC2891846.1 WhiB family transcriptional regulator [Rhodococcus sp. 4CII]